MLSTDAIKTFLGRDWDAVCDGMRSYLATDISILDKTNSSLLDSGGKRLRPMLALLVARAAGGRANADSIKFAVASELLHNATLLHDDVADASDKRRGKPTLRRLMGSTASVLVGDFWLVRAVRAVLDAEKGRDRAVEIFSRTLSDLAEGEMLQLQKVESCDTSFEDYLSIIYNKTASLFVASCTAAALSVGAPAGLENAAAGYGRFLGCAFQMRDDILDYMPDADTGKPYGVDVLEQKITLPLLGALKNVSAARESEIRDMVRHVDAGKRDGILSFVRQNGGLEYAQGILEEYAEKAVRSLEEFPPSEEKDILRSMAGFVAKRLK